MPNPDQILIRRLPVKPQTVKTGLFSKETKFALDGTICDGERLYRVREYGAIEKIDQDKLPNEEGLRLFAVQCDPFDLTFLTDLGREKEGYRWDLNLSGKAKIRDPISFLRLYYYKAKAEPFTVQSFVCALGTRPGNLLLDKILFDSIWEWLKERTKKECANDKSKQEETDDLTIDNINIDFAKWAKERHLTEESFTNVFCENNGTPFGKSGTVTFDVNSFRFFSEEREAARAAQIADDKKRRKQAEELENKKQEVKVAEYDAQIKKLQGGSTESAFAAFETISNVLGDIVSKSGTGTFSEILKDARRVESGLRLLALIKDKKRAGGVTLAKNNPSFSTRAIGGCVSRGLKPLTAKTQVLHYNETLSSTIVCDRREGYLTVLNVSEKNEIVPLLPNGDYPANVRIAHGEKMLVADDSCPMLSGLTETASSGTDHLVALITDEPLLIKPLPPLGDPLPPAEAFDLVSRLASMNECEWAADVNSYMILP